MIKQEEVTWIVQGKDGTISSASKHNRRYEEK
jgi:hypothetical protein